MKKKKALKLMEEHYMASAEYAFSGGYHPTAHSTLKANYKKAHKKLLKALTK